MTFMNNIDLRHALTQRARQRGLFWSFNVADATHIPDALLIEQVLRYGDLPDLKMLFQLFDKTLLRNIWEERLCAVEQEFTNNLFLAEFYFDVPNAEFFLKTYLQENSVYARLKQLERDHADGL
jgi:hypothetical protein